jgi:hypothetical protein
MAGGTYILARYVDIHVSEIYLSVIPNISLIISIGALNLPIHTCILNTMIEYIFWSTIM